MAKAQTVTVRSKLAHSRAFGYEFYPERGKNYSTAQVLLSDKKALEFFGLQTEVYTVDGLTQETVNLTHNPDLEEETVNLTHGGSESKGKKGGK